MGAIDKPLAGIGSADTQSLTSTIDSSQRFQNSNQTTERQVVPDHCHKMDFTYIQPSRPVGILEGIKIALRTH